MGPIIAITAGVLMIILTFAPYLTKDTPNKKMQRRIKRIAQKMTPGSIYIFDLKGSKPCDPYDYTCVVMIIKRRGEWIRYREIFSNKKYNERNVKAIDLATIINESYQ